MKIIVAATCLFLLLSGSTKAAFTETKTESQKIISVDQQAKRISDIQAIINLSRRKYERLVGRRLSLIERFTLQQTRHQLQKQLKKVEETEGFNAGGFTLGLLLNFWGVLGAYIFSRDSNLHKWALFGLGTALVLVLIFTLFFILLAGDK